MFEEKNRIGRLPMIKCNTIINSFCLAMTAGASLKQEQLERDEETPEASTNQQIYFKVDNNITFTASFSTGHHIVGLRGKFDGLVMKFLESRSTKFTQHDQNLIETLAKLLKIEDQHSGFMKTEMSFAATSQQVIQRNHVKPLFRGPSTSASSNPSQFYAEQTKMQKQRKKFFVTKINDYQVDYFNRRRMGDVEDVRLHGWLLDQIYHPKMTSTLIFIIFYSSDNDEFLFYGDVKPAEHRNHSKQFYLKSNRRIPLAELRQKFFFRNFQVLQDSRFVSEEIDFNTGSALIDIFHS